MKIRFRSWILSSIAMVFIVFAIALSVQANRYASYTEVEPNNTCATAQDLTSAASPLQVTGYKTQPYGDAVDFFKFYGTPGTQVHVSLAADFSKPTPLTSLLVGAFTSACPGSYADLGYVGSWDNTTPVQLDFTVPSDGIFIVAADACCDLNFTGSGTIEGAYVLSVTGAQSRPPTPAPIDSTPAGRTYGQWAAAWWQWALGVPDNKHKAESGLQRVIPLKDPDGRACSEHQIGDVWFLAGTWVGDVTRTCTIPAGKSLFFPLINNAYFAFLGDPPEQRTEEYARDQARCTQDATISVLIDGLEVRTPTAYFTGVSGSQSPLFNVQMPLGIAQGGPGNIFESLGYKIKQIPEWFLSPSAEQGYYLFFDPLPAGSHTIAWTASGCTSGATQHVIYNLNVLEVQ
ncbi:hypothetical protein [Desulforhabdus sp. TSK]|uniref:hypothetical protein n=1 Tax=Desulforhabdus sp. TSK TaxID=2925014 RepID=UPI001FC86EDF|nr:hypothetical protein [Desulforhabdus sp. TSK]GKT10766.1 hypothetical protein DSTSK_40710 [Desulforhabdus sp. TSK]